MSILIDSVQVSAFGGIRCPMTLDLSAPLTLIYAPNGTGKTSFIESIDWLLGGDARAARCMRADPDELTRVEFKSIVNGRRLIAGKSIGVSGKLHRAIDGQIVGEAEFLKSLAPDCDVSELSALAQIPRLKSYLSTNRVLGVGSLSKLIDSESADVRADAMADLTGTRSQRNAQKSIDLYRKRLREKLSRLNELRSDLGARQKDYLEISASRVDVDRLKNEVIRVVDPDRVGVIWDQSALVIKANREHGDLLARLEALGRLRGLLNEPNLHVDFLPLQDRMAKIESDLEARRSLMDAQTFQLRELSGKASLSRKMANGIRSSLSSLGELNAIFREDIKFSDLLLAREEYHQLRMNSEELRQQLDRLSKLQSQISSSAASKAQIEEKLSELSSELSDIAARSVLDSRLIDLKSEIDVARKGRRHAAALKEEAIRTSLLAHQHAAGAAECPACGHDWKSSEQLGRALREALDSLPEFESSLVKYEAKILGEIGMVESQLEKVDVLERQISLALVDLDNISNMADEAGRLAALFGHDSIKTIGHVEISEWSRRIEADVAFSAFESSMAESGSSYCPGPRESLRDGLDILGKLYDDLQVDAATKDAAAAELLKDIDLSEVGINELIEQSSSLRSVFKEREVLLQSVAELTKIVKSYDFPAESLDEVEARLRQRRDDVASAVDLLKIVGDVDATSMLSSKAEQAARDAQAVARDVEAVQREIMRIDEIYERLEDHSSRSRQRIVDAVGPSVSQLFLRMQVNKVFKSVDVNSSFQLKGLLDGHLLEPQLFSSGQRQDLALAFFLVRAYTLGGSFFLDEPLAHLDDLNRVAVLDTLRAFVLSGQESRRSQTRLLITTASWTTTKHVIQKFMRIESESPLLRAYQLTGNVSSSVGHKEIFPARN